MINMRIQQWSLFREDWLGDLGTDENHKVDSRVFSLDHFSPLSGHPRFVQPHHFPYEHLHGGGHTLPGLQCEPHVVYHHLSRRSSMAEVLLDELLHFGHVLRLPGTSDHLRPPRTLLGLLAILESESANWHDITDYIILYYIYTIYLFTHT